MGFPSAIDSHSAISWRWHQHREYSLHGRQVQVAAARQHVGPRVYMEAQVQNTNIRRVCVCACVCAVPSRQWLAQHNLCKLAVVIHPCCGQVLASNSTMLANSISLASESSISAAIKSRPRAHWRTCSRLLHGLHDMYFDPADCLQRSTVCSTGTMFPVRACRCICSCICAARAGKRRLAMIFYVPCSIANVALLS